MPIASHRIVSSGDAALVLEFPGDRIDPAISARTAALAQSIDAIRFAGVRDVVPAYRSVAVYFDPLRTNQAALVERLDALANASAHLEPAAREIIEVPVCYGGEFGPDLPSVATFAGLSESQVIERHAGTLYRVLMLGFLPGFAYMGIVDSQIAAPRLATPRHRVPRGSVGIAKEQTGVYPIESPGGWQLIGRTPLRPFDATRAEPFLFRSGDAVRFVPIAREEFDAIDRPRT